MEKRLTRSRKDKRIFGVCGGLANYFEIDPTIIRLVWVLSILYWGVGGFAYLLAGLIMPRDEEVM